MIYVAQAENFVFFFYEKFSEILTLLIKVTKSAILM